MDRSPARVRTAVNDRHLIDVSERDLRRLADMLEETAASYLAAASAIGTSEGVAILTADGLVLEPAVMTCLLLGEQLAHGLDIARAAHRPWRIGRDDALLVIPAALSLAPQYLRPSRTRNLNVSFELRIRGGCRYRMAITDGTGVVTAAGETVPEALKEQVKVGGIIVMPVGPHDGIQKLMRLERMEDGFNEKMLADVRFVPLIPGRAARL